MKIIFKRENLQRAFGKALGLLPSFKSRRQPAPPSCEDIMAAMQKKEKTWERVYLGATLLTLIAVMGAPFGMFVFPAVSFSVLMIPGIAGMAFMGFAVHRANRAEKKYKEAEAQGAVAESAAEQTPEQVPAVAAVEPAAPAFDKAATPAATASGAAPVIETQGSSAPAPKK